MDISERYIKMCEKAQEIQECRKEFKPYQYGDFYKDFEKVNVAKYTCDGDGEISDDIRFEEDIWLPRQDQLQEMIEWTKQELEGEDELLKQYEAYLSRFCSWINTSGGGKIFNSFKYKQLFDSLEQLWLVFVMKEKYNKVWNEEKQDWIVL